MGSFSVSSWEFADLLWPAIDDAQSHELTRKTAQLTQVEVA
jgi:hypothetical protein